MAIRLTESRLRQIIREEAARFTRSRKVNESGDNLPYEHNGVTWRYSQNTGTYLPPIGTPFKTQAGSTLVYLAPHREEDAVIFRITSLVDGDPFFSPVDPDLNSRITVYDEDLHLIGW